MAQDLRTLLRQCLRGRVCLLGVGNPDHGDDGFGVALIEALLESDGTPVNETGSIIHCASAGLAPSRFITPIVTAGFDRVIFIDTVDFHAAPGSLALLDSGEMTSRFPQVSTHIISLGMLAKWLHADAGIEAWLLAGQPESLRPGHGLSAALSATLSLCRELLRSAAGPGRPFRGFDLPFCMPGCDTQMANAL